MSRRRNPPPRGSAGAMEVDAGATGSVHVEIRNWTGGSEGDVTNFINRKCGVWLQNTKRNGNVLTALVDPAQAGALRKLSGIRFAGSSLDIKTSEQPSEQTSTTISLLLGFLSQRYNPAIKLLDLTSMYKDQTLAQHGLLASPATTVKMFTALMKLASENIGPVESVSLEGNDLVDINSVSALAHTYPHLLNLSLANNRISGQGLEAWKNKFPNLRELILAGNPVANQQQLVLGMFPRLVILDGAVVRNEAELPSNKLPVLPAPLFFENETIAKIANDFVASFFSLWDADRSQLISLYDHLSVFSVCLDLSAPHNGHRNSSNQPYMNASRNLVRNLGTGARLNRIYRGPDAIKTASARLPKSKHDLSQTSEFAMEAIEIKSVRTCMDAGILLVVHGAFVEPGAREQKWSFDRSMAILPGPNGALLLASDMLTVRNYSGSEAFTASVPAPHTPHTPVNQQGVHPVPQTPTPHQPTPPPVPAGAQEMVQLLMQQTRLSFEYAQMCAQQANFDLQQALALFEQSRSTLPPGAFV